jgi:hypothetical protein
MRLGPKHRPVLRPHTAFGALALFFRLVSLANLAGCLPFGVVPLRAVRTVMA